MAESLIIRRGGGGVNLGGTDVTFIAQDQLKIGDMVYTVKGIIYADAVMTALDSAVNCASFSPDGTMLVLGGFFTGNAKKYSVSGTIVTYLGDIYADAGTTALDYYVNCASFSPDGTMLVLGGYFTGNAKKYSVSGTTITYLGDIYADDGTTDLANTVNSASFSPDGTMLVLGGAFIGYAKKYSVSGTTVTFLSDIYADDGTTALDYDVNSASFSPDGTMLVLGGYFAGNAKKYSVSGITITYLGDIYADAGTTAFENTVNSASFSPDGTMLVLGGDFTGNAKKYSVSGTTVTFLSDIYADAGTTALDNDVYSASFSPDGTMLVLGGYFTGYAKKYSVSGTTITYLGDIYADDGTTALDYDVYSTSFSPDGTMLVLGVDFIGYANRYLVSGTTVTYLVEARRLARENYILDTIRSSKIRFYDVGVGYSTQAVNIGDSVTVKVLY